MFIEKKIDHANVPEKDTTTRTIIVYGSSEKGRVISCFPAFEVFESDSEDRFSLAAINSNPQRSGRRRALGSSYKSSRVGPRAVFAKRKGMRGEEKQCTRDYLYVIAVVKRLVEYPPDRSSGVPPSRNRHASKLTRWNPKDPVNAVPSNFQWIICRVVRCKRREDHLPAICRGTGRLVYQFSNNSTLRHILYTRLL